MPATDFQGSSTPSHSHSSPFSSFGRSLLSLRRDTPASASAAAAMPPPGVEPEMEEFHGHVAAHLADLRAAGGGGEEEFMSIKWIRRLLEAFLLCQEEFRVLAAEARRRGALPAQAERLAAEFGERAVRALDVCNAARDGVDQARRWERLAGIAASALLAPPGGEIHEGQLRRARKALADLAVLLIDDAAAAAGGGCPGVASFLASHRNRSFGRARASPSRAAGHHGRSGRATRERGLGPRRAGLRHGLPAPPHRVGARRRRPLPGPQRRAPGEPPPGRATAHRVPLGAAAPCAPAGDTSEARS